MSTLGTYDAETRTLHFPLPPGVTEADVSPPPGEDYSIAERLSWAAEWAMRYWCGDGYDEEEVNAANEATLNGLLAQVAQVVATAEPLGGLEAQGITIEFHPAVVS